MSQQSPPRRYLTAWRPRTRTLLGDPVEGVCSSCFLSSRSMHGSGVAVSWHRVSVILNFVVVFYAACRSNGLSPSCMVFNGCKCISSPIHDQSSRSCGRSAYSRAFAQQTQQPTHRCGSTSPRGDHDLLPTRQIRNVHEHDLYWAPTGGSVTVTDGPHSVYPLFDTFAAPAS